MPKQQEVQLTYQPEDIPSNLLPKSREINMTKLPKYKNFE